MQLAFRFKALQKYQHYVQTGEVKTNHPVPKFLGATSHVLCIDKPSMFTCNYGGGGKLPWRVKAESPTQLLNSSKASCACHFMSSEPENVGRGADSRVPGTKIHPRDLRAHQGILEEGVGREDLGFQQDVHDFQAFSWNVKWILEPKDANSGL